MAATPPPLLLASVEGGYCRSGNELRVRAGAHPPSDRCVKCGAPSTSAPVMTFAWHHPVIYLAVFAGVFVYVILALVLRETVSFRIGLCARHTLSRRLWLVGSAVGIVAFIGGLFWAGSMESGMPLLVVSLPGIVLAIVGSRLSRTLQTIVIRERTGRFRGACEAFLSSIPACPPVVPGPGK